MSTVFRKCRICRSKKYNCAGHRFSPRNSPQPRKMFLWLQEPENKIIIRMGTQITTWRIFDQVAGVVSIFKDEGDKIGTFLGLIKCSNKGSLLTLPTSKSCGKDSADHHFWVKIWIKKINRKSASERVVSLPNDYWQEINISIFWGDSVLKTQKYNSTSIGIQVFFTIYKRSNENWEKR